VLSFSPRYFESPPPEHKQDKRRFGYSRDKCKDCVQVVIALIVTPEGFPIAYETLPGNTSDKTTLRDMLRKIEAQYGKANRIWVMDWIYSRHDVLDRAVFPGRVHCLEEEQQRPAILGVKHILLIREPFGTALEEFGGLALVHLQTAGVAGVKVLEAESLAAGDAEWVDVLLDAAEDLFFQHDATLLSRSHGRRRRLSPS
jgi:hypothetical protein